MFLKSLKFIKALAPFAISAFVLFVLSTGIANAEGNDAGAVTKLLGFANFFDFISQAIAQFFFQLQTIASWLIIMAGFLLNFSVNLTLNIKTFVDNTPAIYTTWKALRDITGMVIIFFLLYEAIQLIIGIRSTKFKQLIVNIVIGGVLINFSFFFASLGIDVSNIISKQLYTAIAPASSLSASNLSTTGVTKIAIDGGLSDIFMQALKIPSLYDVTGQRTAAGAASGGGTWTQPFQIMLVGVTSTMIMVTAAFSFALAALMFIVRFVILLFLLAFSPIWFMSFISPEIKKYTGKWEEYYKNMLIIMPIYLLLMYMALNVLSSQTYFGHIGTTDTSSVSATPGKTGMIDEALAATGGSNTGGNWYDGILSLAVNAAVVIIMMNIPLLGAISVGGGAVKFLNADKFGADAMWKRFSNYAGTNTAGRFGNWADKKLENTRIGNSMLGRDIRSSTVGALANSKMGIGRSFSESGKEQKEINKKQREIDNKNALSVAIAKADHARIRELLGKMTTKEIESLDKNILTNQHVIPHISSTVYKNIDKGDRSDSDKSKILGARFDALNNAATNGDVDKVKQIMKNMSGDDIASIIENIPAGGVVNDIFIQNLKPGQLKDMEHIDEPIRRQIGQRIHTWGTRPGATGNHAAYDYIDKNQSLWL